LEELAAPLDSITNEAAKLGTFEPERIRKSFPDPAVHEVLDELRDDFVHHTGLLRAAIQHEDAGEARTELVAIDRIIEAARRLAARRYVELVGGEATLDLRPATEPATTAAPAAPSSTPARG
jgi:hypothetical protein